MPLDKNITDIKDIRHPSRKQERKAAAKKGWFNWYKDRGRWVDGQEEKSARQKSWRRVF